jgi:molybdopterin converting factor small subunit
MTTSIETSLEKSAETSTDANLAQGAIESVQERVSTRVLFKWPGALKKRFGLPERFSFPGGDLMELLESVESSHAGFLEKVTEADGALRPYLRIYVNSRVVDPSKAKETSIQEGDTVLLLLSLAGG